MVWFILYVSAIFGANWAITTFGIIPVGFGLSAPAGVYFAGACFVLRNQTQETLGRRWSIAAIPIGAALSAFLSPQFAIASGAAFLLSESADYLIYTPLRRQGRIRAMLASCACGDVVDSILFLLIAFGSVQFLAGQVIGKWTVVLLTIVGMRGWRALSEWQDIRRRPSVT